MYKSISDLLKTTSEKNGEKTALYIRRIFRTQKISYIDLYVLSQKTASFLKKQSIKQEDKIILWAPNMPEWVVAFFGITVSGAVAVPIGLHTSDELLDKYLKQTKAKAAFVSKHFPESEILNKKGLKIFYLEDLLNQIKNQKNINLAKVDQNSLAEILYTSGTTGDPKGVRLTHKNLIFTLNQVLKIVPKDNKYRMLSILPLSHIMEQMLGLFGPLSLGTTIYYLPQVNPLTIKKAMKKHKITHLGVVPQILKIFLDHIEHEINQEGKTSFYNLSLKFASALPLNARKLLFRKIHENLGGKLEAFIVGGAPLDQKLAQSWENLGIKIIEAYGATETTGAATASRFEKRKLGSPGKKIPNIEIQISQDGEILVKGKNVTQGYFKKKKKALESFTQDGFFKTGDIGYFDKKGFLHIVGREKFKIVTASGEKIYPEDIERKLNAHPAIWDSCVFGLKKNESEEIVYASVILKKETKKELELIFAEINKTLETHQQILEYSIWPQKDFPRLHTLKVDREKVKIQVEEGYKEKDQVKKPVQETDTLKEILSLVCKVSPDKIQKNTNLVTDLDIDSLKRVALVSLIEEEFGVQINESLIGPGTKVKDVRKLIKKAPTIKDTYNYEKIADYLKSPFGRKMKLILQDICINLLFKPFVNLKIFSQVDFEKSKPPFVLIGNHLARADIYCTSFLPKKLKEYIVFPVAEKHWHRKLFGTAVLASGGFPIDRKGGAIQGAMEMMADLLEEKFAMVVFPEGKLTPKGKKLGKLKRGTEMLLVDTDIPIIPFYISGNLKNTFPNKTRFPLLPHGRSNVTIKIGKPFYLKSDNESEPTSLIKQKILELSE